MNKFLLIITLFLAPVAAFSQAELVINGTTAVTIVESGGTSATPIYIEIANPAASAINTKGKNGWIISESEFNMVKWDIGSTAGIDSVPFGYGTSYKLPVVVTQSAGSAGGSILFSTYHTLPDQAAGATSTTGMPSDVTNMHAMNSTGSPTAADNSYNAVDRFWIIDTYKTGFAYGTKPTVSQIAFNYIHGAAVSPAEFIAPNTVLDESDLLAQRFNPAAGKGWSDFEGGAGSQTTNAANVGTVLSGAVAATAFYRSWTLANSLDPLPIQLSSFTAQCDNDSALIQWTSQTELNNDFYTVEKTTDGIHYSVVAKIKGAGTGTSSLPNNYSVTDNAPFAGQSYYVLYQTDFDGNRNQVGPPIIFNGCGSNNVTAVNAYNTPSYIQVDINSIDNTNFNISLVNMLGQTIYSTNHAVALGNNEIRLPNNVSAGLYILNVRNSEVNYCQKMVIGVR